MPRRSPLLALAPLALGLAACPEETINDFDFGLSRRKAIYLAHPGCYPPIPAIDEMLMMEPPPAAFIGPATARMPRNTPSWLIWMTRM